MATPPVPDERRSMPDLRWSGFTHVGHVRKNNEDAFLALTFDGHEVRFLRKVGEAAAAKTDFIFAVSDGLGGAQSGEFASRITIEQVCHLLPRSFRLSAAGLAGGYTELLPELFSRIHRELITLARSYEECRDMGTTLSLVWLTPDRLYFCHVGDSRVYYLPQTGPLAQVSHDHSHVGWLRRNGKLNEREARTHPMRNALNQALGAGHQFVDPQVGAIVYEPGDQFLLCTDGLCDGLWDHDLEENLRTPPAAGDKRALAERLVEAALERSGRDNTTAIVVETLAPAPAASPPPA
jgi:serine/threonine protein phosphatase PrpC